MKSSGLPQYEDKWKKREVLKAGGQMDFGIIKTGLSPLHYDNKLFTDAKQSVNFD